MFYSFDSNLKTNLTKPAKTVNFESSELLLLTAFNTTGIESFVVHGAGDSSKFPTAKIVPSGKSSKNTERIKLKFFNKKTFRSTTGCLSCKRRKKKCDETKPICGACNRLNLDCVYKSCNSNSGNRSDRSLKHKTGSVVNFHSRILSNKHTDGRIQSTIDTMEYINVGPQALNTEVNTFIDNKTNVDDILKTVVKWDDDVIFNKNIYSARFDCPDPLRSQALKCHELLNSMMSPTLLHQPTDFIAQKLDEKGTIFFDFYRYSICETISVSSEEEKFFKSYFLKLANHEPSILYSLVAWGGALLADRDDDTVLIYRTKAEKCINEIISAPEISRRNYKTVLSFCLILKGLNVSSGDTKNWYQYMKQFKVILYQYGGLEKFCCDSIHENEATWLISNFFYHDVINSHSLQSETLIPVEDYIKVFQEQNVLDASKYGLDPSFGCITEVVVVLAEISLVRKSIRNMMASIKSFKSGIRGIRQVGGEDSIDSDMISRLYLELKIMKEKSIAILECKIENIKPNATRLITVLDNHSLLELHLTLFELYQYVLKGCVLIMIKGVNCDDAELASALNDIVIRFDIIIGSKLESVLCFPLLMIGLCCCSFDKREIFNIRYSQLCSSYMLKNIIRMKEMVLKCWDIYEQNDGFSLDDCLVISKNILHSKVCFT